MRSLFITGTDTGVGKTFVGCGLAAAVTAQGKTVGVLKPAETGCVMQEGSLYPEDATRLAVFARSSLPLNLVCPYRFAPPVAPSVAATMAGTTIEPERIIAYFHQITAQHDFTIVEGAGGLLVPLAARYTFANLARDLAIPVLVVVGSKLGALNHTLLTLHCAQAMALQVAGYIVNHPTPLADQAIQTNVHTLAQLTDVPCLGIVPCTPLSNNVEQDRTNLSLLFSRAVDLSALLG